MGGFAKSIMRLWVCVGIIFLVLVGLILKSKRENYSNLHYRVSVLEKQVNEMRKNAF